MDKFDSIDLGRYGRNAGRSSRKAYAGSGFQWNLCLWRVLSQSQSVLSHLWRRSVLAENGVHLYLEERISLSIRERYTRTGRKEKEDPVFLG